MKLAAIPTPWTAMATPTWRGEGWMGKTTGPRRMKDSATTVVPSTMHNLIYKDKYQEMWSSLVEAVVAHCWEMWWLIG